MNPKIGAKNDRLFACHSFEPQVQWNLVVILGIEWYNIGTE